jgi:IS4 transposase
MWFRVVVLLFVHHMSPILDIMAVALLALHDAMDDARMAVITVVRRMTAQFPLGSRWGCSM